MNRVKGKRAEAALIAAVCLSLVILGCGRAQKISAEEDIDKTAVQEEASVSEEVQRAADDLESKVDTLTVELEKVVDILETTLKRLKPKLEKLKETVQDGLKELPSETRENLPSQTQEPAAEQERQRQ